MLGVLALHIGLAWLLLRTHFRPVLPPQPVPISVNLLVAQAERPPEPAKLKQPTALLPPVMHFAIPTFNTELSPSPTATAAYAPVQQEQARAPEAAAPVPAQALAPAPPAVKQIAPNAVRYLAEPRLTVPLLSRRLGESGIVHLRIVVDARGNLKEATLKKSSGFERIDAQALQDIRTARFAPYLENGQPLEWETTALLSYELLR
jgi:protein TonB